MDGNHIDLGALRNAGVDEGFEYGLVGVLQLHILAHKGYVDFVERVLQIVAELA